MYLNREDQIWFNFCDINFLQSNWFSFEIEITRMLICLLTTYLKKIPSLGTYVPLFSRPTNWTITKSIVSFTSKIKNLSYRRETTIKRNLPDHLAIIKKALISSCNFTRSRRISSSIDPQRSPAPPGIAISMLNLHLLPFLGGAANSVKGTSKVWWSLQSNRVTTPEWIAPTTSGVSREEEEDGEEDEGDMMHYRDG